MKHPHYVPQFDFVFFNPYHGNFIPRSTQEIFEGKRSVLIGLPGAFTPVCSNYQIPGYEEKADRLKELGVDQVCAVLVNDGWVLSSWARALNINNIKLLSDGNGEFTEKMNMLVSYRHLHFGWRSWRYSCLIEPDMKIKKSWIEKGFTNNPMDDPYHESSVENVITYLENENNG